VALPAVARRCCGNPIDLYPPGSEQQTRRTLLQRANGTDRLRTERRTDTVPFQDPVRLIRIPCGSASNAITVTYVIIVPYKSAEIQFLRAQAATFGGVLFLLLFLWMY